MALLRLLELLRLLLRLPRQPTLLLACSGWLLVLRRLLQLLLLSCCLPACVARRESNTVAGTDLVLSPSCLSSLALLPSFGYL